MVNLVLKQVDRLIEFPLFHIEYACSGADPVNMPSVLKDVLIKSFGVAPYFILKECRDTQRKRQGSGHKRVAPQCRIFQKYSSSPALRPKESPIVGKYSQPSAMGALMGIIMPVTGDSATTNQRIPKLKARPFRVQKICRKPSAIIRTPTAACHNSNVKEAGGTRSICSPDGQIINPA